MAINDQPDVRCSNTNLHGDTWQPRAVAFARDATSNGRPWWFTRCQECLDDLAGDPDPVFVDVVYLDPTRKRRPQPNQPPINDDEFRSAYLRAAYNYRKRAL